MIKLKDLIEQSKKLKTEIPDNPFDNVKDYEDEMFEDTDQKDWRDDDDQNMDDEEWEEFQNYLDTFVNDLRQKDLTNKLIDVDELITEFLLMDEETREVLDTMDTDEINRISKILHQKRKDGNTCSFYKQYGIKYLGDKGKLKYDWEKDYYDKHHRR